MYDTYRKLRYLTFALSFAGGPAIPTALTADHHSTSETQATSNESTNAHISRSMVRQVQRELKNRGYYEGAIDGINSSQTRMAVQKFQRSENIVETGTLNDATLKSLSLDNAERHSRSDADRSADKETNQRAASAHKDTRGEANRSVDESAESPNHAGTVDSGMVRSAQRQLKRDGYYNGEVDGVMGSETRDALRQYQQEQKLQDTGRLTRETAQSLGINTSR